MRGRGLRVAIFLGALLGASLAAIGGITSAASGKHGVAEGKVTYLLSGGAGFSCAATFRFDWGDGSTPATGRDRQTALHHTYAAGAWRASLKETFAKPTVECSFQAPSGGRFSSQIEHFSISCFAGQATCSVSALGSSFAGQLKLAPKSPPRLPQVHGGDIVPLLGGKFAYWEPVTRLNQFWGIPSTDPLLQCRVQACPFQRGHDQVAPEDQERPQSNAPHLVTAVSFSSAAGGTKPAPADNAIANSTLRGWKTPDGVHIGMTGAEAKRRTRSNPSFFCAVEYHVWETCSYRSKPYVFPYDGVQRRQVFDVYFTYDIHAPIVWQIGANSAADEGRCTVNADRESSTLLLGATCWGPLISATFVSVDGGRFGQKQPGAAVNGPTMAVDNAGTNYLAQPLSNLPTVEARLVSPTEASFDVAQCDLCYPGRGATTPAWPSGTFEEWRLSGSWAFASSRSAPMVTFTAHFVGMPSFTLTLPASGRTFG